MKARLLKIARSMAKLRKQLKNDEVTITKAKALAKIAEIEIRAIIAAHTI